nr:MAG TPA: hypothetical protein [Caudoviricetes sp.]
MQSFHTFLADSLKNANFAVGFNIARHFIHIKTQL